jgi:hypothetical protein
MAHSAAGFMADFLPPTTSVAADWRLHAFKHRQLRVGPVHEVLILGLSVIVAVKEQQVFVKERNSISIVRRKEFFSLRSLNPSRARFTLGPAGV